MKLHSSYIREGTPCGPTVLSFLNVKSAEKTIRPILKFRRKHKPWTNEWVEKNNYYNDYRYLYFNEVKHFFARHIKRVQTPKKRQTFKSFIKDKKGTYLIWTTQHIQIVKDGRIFDTSGQDITIGQHLWPNSWVKYYAKLIDKKK